MLYQLFFALQIALAWYFALSAVTAVVFAAAGPLVRAWLRKDHGATRPFALRLFPSAVSVGIVVGLVVPAFAVLEPYRSAAAGERPGWTALVLAIAGAAVFAFSVGRGLMAVWQTRRGMIALYENSVATRDRASGTSVFISDHPVPCVVLDGLVKPRLLVSRSVVDGLTGEEFERAVAHELAHHRARDNAKRRLLAFAPDLVSRTSLARELEYDWKRSAEVEADAAAAGTEMQAVALASALVKVARLAEGKPRLDVGRAAFHDGAPVAHRVRALCERETFTPSRQHGARILFGATAAVLTIAGVLNTTAPFLPTIHRITEWLVHLP